MKAKKTKRPKVKVGDEIGAVVLCTTNCKVIGLNKDGTVLLHPCKGFHYGRFEPSLNDGKGGWVAFL